MHLTMIVRKFCFVLVAFFLLSGKAFSFKIDTHIWIAQQIINEINSGNGEFSFMVDDFQEVVGSYDHSVLQDIINYPAYFRMGTIGPDAFPGMIEGQTLIHPGHDHKGWGTGEWLRYLMDNAKPGKERAFVLGFISHAASDMIAHTYVNTYSGGEFNLMDGYEEEDRHYTLEGYIANFNPKVVDEYGNYLGQPHELVLDGGELAIPMDFVLNVMLFGKKAQDQFKGGPSALFVGIKNVQNEIDRFLKPGGKLEQIELDYIEAIAAAQTGLKINREQAKKLRKVAEKVEKLKDKTADGIIKLIEGTSDVLEKGLEIQSEFERKQIELLEEATKVGWHLSSKAVEHTFAIAELTRQIAEIVVDNCNKACETKLVEEKVCSTKTPLGCINEVVNLVPKMVSPGLCFTCKQIADSKILEKEKLEGLRQDTIKLLEKVEDEIDKTFDEIKKIHQEIVDARLDTLKFAEEQLINVVELGKIYASLSPVRAILQQWSDNITVVGKEYILANGQMIVNTIDPNHGPTFSLLTDWLKCQLPKAIGIPAFIPDVICSTIDYIGKMNEHLSGIKEALFKSNPLTRKIFEAYDREMAKIIAKVEEESLKALSKAINVDAHRLYQILTKKIDDHALDGTFSDPAHNRGKGLILFNNGQNISQRIKAEMNLQGGKSFDKNNYSVVKFAIRMTKLALMPSSGLEKMGFSLGYERLPTYGDSLFAPSEGAGTILFDSIRSIDGNHQWLQVAPPLPKALVKDLTGCRGKRYSYQYSFLDKDTQQVDCGNEGTYSVTPKHNHGFRMYVNENARQAMFKKLFNRILAPGIENPKSLDESFTEVLPEDYPYRVCEKEPFPLAYNDSSCVEQVLSTQVSALYASVGAPAEVISSVKEKVEAANYGILKPLYDYEKIHPVFLKEQAESERLISDAKTILTSVGTEKESLREATTLLDEFDRETELDLSKDELVALERDVQSLLVSLNNSTCGGKLTASRKMNLTYEEALRVHGTFVFEDLVADINFKDFDYFAEESFENIQILKSNLTAIEEMQDQVQSSTIDAEGIVICERTESLLSDISVLLDKSSTDEDKQDVDDLKDELDKEMDEQDPSYSSLSEIDTEAKAIIQLFYDSLASKSYGIVWQSYAFWTDKLNDLNNLAGSEEFLGTAGSAEVQSGIDHAVASMKDKYERTFTQVNLTSLVEATVQSINENIELLDLIAEGWNHHSEWSTWLSNNHAGISQSGNLLVVSSPTEVEQLVKLIDSLVLGEGALAAVLEQEGL